MQTGGKARGAGPQMRGKLQVMSARQSRDPHHLGDAATDCEIGLEDVDSSEHRQVAEIMPGELALAGGDRYIGHGAHGGATGLVVGGRYQHAADDNRHIQ
jgi:hypothetical protein